MYFKNCLSLLTQILRIDATACSSATNIDCSAHQQPPRRALSPLRLIPTEENYAGPAASLEGSQLSRFHHRHPVDAHKGTFLLLRRVVVVCCVPPNSVQRLQGLGLVLVRITQASRLPWCGYG